MDEANKGLGEDPCSAMGVLYGPVATRDYCKCSRLHHKSQKTKL